LIDMVLPLTWILFLGNDACTQELLKPCKRLDRLSDLVL